MARTNNIQYSATVSNKRIAKNSLLLYIRMGFVMAISLFSVRILLKELGVENYGIYNAIGGVVTSLAFISTVLANASQRYFAFAIGQQNITALNLNFKSILLVYTVIILIILVIGETLGIWFIENKMQYSDSSSNEIYWVFQFSLLTLLLHLLNAPFLAMLIAHEDMNPYAIISIIDAVLKLIIVYSLSLFSNYRLSIYPFLLCILSFFILIFYIITVKRKYSYITIMPKFHKQSFINILSYSGWSGFGAIAGVCYNQGINIMFNIFVGPMANAAYAIANQINSAVSTFGSSFFTAVRPGMVKCYSQNNLNKLFNLYLLSSKLIFVLLYLVILPILFQTNNILSLWLGNTSAYMIQFTQLILISCMISFLGLPITTIVQASGKVRNYHIIVDGFLCSSIVIIYYCFKTGIYPSIILWIVNLMYCIAHILRLLYLHKLTGLSIKLYIIKFAFPVSLIIIISIFMMYLLNEYFNLKNIIGIILNVILSTTITLTLSYILLINKSDRHTVLSLIKRRK